MTANLSAAATKTLTTFAAVEFIDCYAGTAGVDCRSLKALVRKGLLVKVAGGYSRHAITPAGRAAIGAPVEAPTAPKTVHASAFLIMPPVTAVADYTPEGAAEIDAVMAAKRRNRRR